MLIMRHNHGACMPFDNNKSDNTMTDFKSPLEMLYHWETNHPNDVYLRQPINGKVHNFTWAENWYRNMSRHHDG